MEMVNLEPLNFLEMAEDVLLQILSELDIQQLVGIERVSKRFQSLSKLTVKLMKTEIDCSAMVKQWRQQGSRVGHCNNVVIEQFIERYGTGLERINTYALFGVIRRMSSLYDFSKLAKFAPNVLDFGFVENSKFHHVLKGSRVAEWKFSVPT